ncbi:sensor histidine kinase [Pseudaeromonas paramecii]|uniref:histidine kinase n=1 Tax=Pseudaeromonas paramecii TaxID=2138166 RepID=A0ABP8Q2N4_9GAMM
MSLDSLRQRYFAAPEHQRDLQPGERLLEQGAHNRCLYLLLEGRVRGRYLAAAEGEWLDILQVEAGRFMGVHSFFSRSFVSYCRLEAMTPCRVAWLDAEALNEVNSDGLSLTEQFMPVIMEELKQRQLTLNQAYLQQMHTERQLLQAEKMSTLGQLAAGVAHELNNAIAVIAHSSHSLISFISGRLGQPDKPAQDFFNRALRSGQLRSSSQLRQEARVLEQTFGLGATQARQFARMLEGAPVGQADIAALAEGVSHWELGRECHDMALAVKHATNIVRSVKQLGGGEAARHPGVQLLDTIDEALALLNSPLRRINLQLALSPLTPLLANETEWVQIWVNIIKNGCDALAQTPNPTIWIRADEDSQGVRVLVGNNGPQIPPTMLERIFEPHFTTKREGQRFGLGLGLAIVKGLVDSYGGSLAVCSQAAGTEFSIRIPKHHG